MFATDPVGLVKQLSPSSLAAYKKFKEYWVDRPVPEYASTKSPRTGVGTVLYTATNNWIKDHLGLHLWSSTNQTADAKGIWSKFRNRGLTTMESRPRFLAAACRVALRYWWGP